MFTNNSSIAVWHDIADLGLADKVRKGDMRPIPYASIRDAQGFGINFVLMPLDALLLQKKVIECAQEQCFFVSRISGRSDAFDKHVRDGERLERLAKRPPAKWYQRLAPRRQKVRTVEISL